jgi:ketosteroid isomerase-like protein
MVCTLQNRNSIPPLMTLLEQATHLQEMAAGPDILDAVDRYYAEDVTVVEATGETFHGRETQKGRVRDFMASIKAMHDGGVASIAANESASGEGVVLVEAWSDMTFADGTRMKLEEVAVQRWKGGKVVHERFYYNVPGGAPGSE